MTTQTITAKKATLPTPEKIMSFTRDMIESLPSWTEHDKIELGSFAKHGWMKAPSSLVFIIQKTENGIAYINCSNFNGAIGRNFYAGSTYLRDTIVGKMWVSGPMNMYSDIEYYVTNPERTV